MFFDYVFLTYFNDLIQAYTPFVRQIPETKGVNVLNQYEYTGGNVDHRAHFIDNENDHNSLDKYSDLAKDLLEYIPLVNDNGNDDYDKSIGSVLFGQAISVIKDFIKSDSDYHDILYDQVTEQSKLKFIELIHDFKNKVPNLNGDLKRAINSITKYIFNNHSDDYVFNMFFNMMMKQEDSDYHETSYDNIRGGIASYGIKSRQYNAAGYNITNMLNSALLWYFNTDQDYQEYFKDLITDTVNYTTNNITFKINGHFVNVHIKNKASSNNIGINFSKTNLSEITVDDLVDVINQYFHMGFMKSDVHDYYGSNTQQAKEDLFNLLYFGTIQPKLSLDKATKQLRDLSPYRNTALAGVSRMYANIYGTAKSSVFRNVEGNNIPSMQIGTMAEKTQLLIELNKRITETSRIKHSNYINTYAYNCLMSQNKLMHGVGRASSCDINGIKKSASSLNYDELQNVAMIYKFFNNISQDGNNIVYMQPTTYSDKSTQFEVEWDLNQVATGVNNRPLFGTDDNGWTWAQVIMKYLNDDNGEWIFNTLLNDLYNKWIYKYISKTYNIYNEYIEAINQLDDEAKKSEMLSILHQNINTDNFINFKTIEYDYDTNKITDLRTDALQMANNINSLLQKSFIVEKTVNGKKKKEEVLLYSDSFLSQLFDKAGNAYIKNVQYEKLKDRKRSFNNNILLGLQFDFSRFQKYFNYQQQVMAKTMNREGVNIQLNNLPGWIKNISQFKKLPNSKRFIWFDKYGKMKPWQSRDSINKLIQESKNDDEELPFIETTDTKLESQESNEQDKSRRRLNDMIVNPILKIYSFMDAYLSADFNELHLGDPDIHDCKVSLEQEQSLDKHVQESYDPSEVDDMKLIRKYSLFRSSRIVTQNKRAIPDTTSVHSWLHGSTYNMPETAKIALLDSTIGFTHLPNGEQSDMAAHDGGAFSCAYTQYLEN